MNAEIILNTFIGGSLTLIFWVGGLLLVDIYLLRKYPSEENGVDEELKRKNNP